MKSHIVKTTLLGLVAVALTLTPTLSRSQDATNAPAATTPKKHSGYVPFHGAVTAVDAGAETLTVGKLTINITSTTKIINMTNNAPATLSDVAVGGTVSGSYVKDADGKLNAHSLHIGSKAHSKKKPYTANTSTNSVSN
jgi:hypothetical protein